VLSLAQDRAFDDLAGYLVQSLERLASAGAAFAALAANTVHLVFEKVQQRSPIPLVSIVEVAAKKAADLGLRRVGIFGTSPTMEGTFYQEVFASFGIAVVAPSTEERAYVHDKYVSQLVRGIFERTTKERVLRIAEAMRNRDKVEAIILAGTELPLLLHCKSHDGLVFLDTMTIHVEAIVERLRALEGACRGAAAT
jgi:aspartate racemase